MLTRTALLVLAAAVMTPVAPSPSMASLPPPSIAEIGTWGPVALLGRGEISLAKDAIAIDGRGEITAAWKNSNTGKAYTSQRSRGGDWTPRVGLGQGNNAPAIEVDANGVVTALWASPRGLLAARRASGGAWSAPVVLDRHGWEPDLAVGPSGRVVAVWTHSATTGKWRIRAAYHPARGRWTEAVNVTPATGTVGPQVGVDHRGVATVLYTVGGYSDSEPRPLETRRLLPGRGWTAPVALAPQAFSPELATSDAGDAAAVFQRGVRLYALVRGAGGEWGRARVLSPADVDYLGDYSVAFDRDRTVLVTLVASVHGTRRVDLLRLPLGGRWSAAIRMAARGAWLTEAVTGPSGDAFVVWGDVGLYGRYLPAGGHWSERQVISPRRHWPLEDLSVTMGPDGDVVALWARQETFRLRARVFTATR